MTSHQFADLARAPEQREHVTLDAIDAAEAIATGEWTVEDACALVGRDMLIHGLVSYTQLLEAANAIQRGLGDVAPVRQAARDTARMWRRG